MKNFKKLIVAATIVGILGVVGVAGAAVATGATSPADIVAGLTGKSVDNVRAERAAGKTYGTIAQEAGKLDAFKKENLAQKKAMLDERVKAGNLTQAQADATYKSIEANQATCDGAGSAKMGPKNGMSFGQGMGNGGGMGRGMGRGRNTENSSIQ